MVSNLSIKIIIIVLMLGLNGYLLYNANQLSCEQCTVTFNEQGFQETFKMSELFNQTKLDRCPIYWDRVQGYVKS